MWQTMKIGVCGGIERAPIIKALGYHYVEENMSKIAALTEQDFADRVKQYEGLDFPVYSFNGFFGGDVSLYGEASMLDIREYSERALRRAKELGGEICVIGSGKARAIPNGISREFAERRFCDVISLCGDIADKYGIKIAIEPLNSKETNYINTVSDSADIAKRSGKDNVGALVDFFHFFMENESDDSIIKNEDVLIHAHIARPNADRLSPTKDDAKVVAHWAGLLKKIDYKGCVSIEARFVDFEQDIKEAKECFKIIGLM